MHNFNQSSMSDWFYSTQHTPQPKHYEQDWNNHQHSSSSQWGYNSPKSYGQPPNQHSALYATFLEQSIEDKSKLKKSLEALNESEQQIQKLMDSSSHTIFKSNILTLFFKSHRNKKNLLT